MLAITLGVIGHYGYISFNVMLSVFIASFFLWAGGRAFESSKDHDRFIIESLRSIDPEFDFIPKSLAMEMADVQDKLITGLRDQTEFQRDLIIMLELQHDVDNDRIRLLAKLLSERNEENGKTMV